MEKGLRVGGARYHTNRTLLVAPYYGVEKWRPELVEKIKRCAYPQVLWDSLPIHQGRDSILRLDHVQPIGFHSESYDPTPYALSPEAVAMIEEQSAWLRSGKAPPASSIIADIREALLDL